MWYFFDSSNRRFLGTTDNSADILPEHISKQESDLTFVDPFSLDVQDQTDYDWFLGDDGVSVTRVTATIDPPEPEDA